MNSRQLLLRRLASAEISVSLYLNTHKEPQSINRVKKFWQHPYKFLYHNAYKAGLHKRTDYPIDTFWGEKLILPISDENNVTFYYCGALSLSECRLSRFFINTLTPQDVFYDIGANFGYYSFLARALDVGDIHAFEPSDYNMSYIRKNATLDMHLNEVAVTNKSDMIDFYDLSASNKGQMSSLFADYVPEKNRKTQRVLKVKALTLDEYIQEHTPPTIIKMDIENSEHLALDGARELLQKYAPLIAMEVMDTPAHLIRTQKALDILAQANYQPFSILPDGTLQQTELQQLGSLGEFNEIIFKKI